MRAGRWPGLAAAVLLAIAFRDLWLRNPHDPVSDAVFAVGALPWPVVIGAALWLAWQRARRGFSDPRPVHGIAICLAGLALAAFWQAQTADHGALMFVALGFVWVAMAGLVAGRSGLRSQAVSAALLLMGMPLPRPLESEIVWWLQRWTASGASALLQALGQEFEKAGVMLREGERAFQVVDSCSGLTGILLLLLIAVFVREMLVLPRVRALILLGLAPAVGYVVNVFRVAYVASSATTESMASGGGDHSLQGIAVLMGGTMLLYGLGLWLEPKRDVAVLQDPPLREEVLASPRSLVMALAVASSLFLISFVSPSKLSREELVQEPLVFTPIEVEWESRPAPFEPFFDGQFGELYHRRLVRVSEEYPFPFIDVMIGRAPQDAEMPTRLFSSKGLYPGPAWELLKVSRERVWLLDREVESAIAAPNAEAEHALIYVWRVGYRGFVDESLRRFLMGDRQAPHATRSPPLLVRLAAYAPHGGPVALDRAKKRLDRFIAEHREQLISLR